MAKFRRNHTKGGGAFSNSIVRVVAILMIMAYGLYFFSKDALLPDQDNDTVQEYEVPVSTSQNDRYYIPRSPSKDIIHHDWYSLGYNEDHEQAEWVAYELRKDQLQVPNVKYDRYFRPDYDVETRSAFHRDYSNSGYTRGHLAPAGDMAFDLKAIEESYFMSNISPQLEQFNGGIWRELEENIRNWAYDDKNLYITTGPMLDREIITRIGKNKVSVPKYFYKVIVDIKGPEYKGIGFIIENKRSNQPLEKYAMTIDEVEEATGYDFFPDLMSEEMQNKVESQLDLDKWDFDPQKFRTRNARWDK